jgi:hypothetical protein
LGAKQIWKIKTPSKCRFFLWLLVHGRCWTSDRLQRHGLRNNGACALCDEEQETLDHLLPGCVYSKEVWFKIYRSNRWSALIPDQGQLTLHWWLNSRKLVHKISRARFDSIFALILLVPVE